MTDHTCKPLYEHVTALKALGNEAFQFSENGGLAIPSNNDFGSIPVIPENVVNNNYIPEFNRSIHQKTEGPVCRENPENSWFGNTLSQQEVGEALDTLARRSAEEQKAAAMKVQLARNTDNLF